MKFYEEDIQTHTGRIKMIEESSDPTLLKSDKLYWELEKERAEMELNAWQSGKPIVEGRRIERLLRAMGFQWMTFTHNADRSTKFSEYKTIIERLGFTEKCCDRVVAPLAMCNVGDLPVPQIFFTPIHACDAHWLVDNTLAKWHNVPVFNLDVGLNVEKVDLDSLNYIADQLGEFIEWAEKKVPGVKYDEDRHIEIIEIDAIGLRYTREIHQLKKHVPCPVSPQEAFRPDRPGRYYPNMQKVNEYLRILRDELGERVASGKGPYPEERLRLLWATGDNPYDTKAWWRLLMDQKIGMPLMYRGTTTRFTGLKYAPYGEVSEYGIKLSPLQEEARWLDTNTWGGSGKRWIADLLDTARDIGAHGIVHDLLIGCTPILGIGRMLSERAEKELGIPVLNVERRQLDKDYMTEEKFEEILSPFVDKCFEWAGKPRQ